MAIGCYKDAATVEELARKRRQLGRPFYREFVVIPENVQNRNLPRGLINGMRMRSHLKVDCTAIIVVQDNTKVATYEFKAVQSSLLTKGMKITVEDFGKCDYGSYGDSFEFVVTRISCAY